jgi:MFS superfamily sulfate permease-like transporter
MKYLAVFLSVGMVEIVWTWYFMAIADREPLRAGIFSAMIIGFGSYTTVSYVHDHRMVWPAMLAAVVFTYAVVWFKNRTEQQPKVSDIAQQIRKELLETDEWESYP